MFEIKSFGSGSAGNCYTVTDGTTKILLEAGIGIKDIKKALDFKVSSLAGALVSHSHGDHAKAVKDVAKLGVNVFMSDGTAKELGINHHRIMPVNPRQAFTIGTLRIMAFEVEHDTDAPFGFLIQNEAGEKLLFATDTYFIRYKFKGITHLMIECNFSEEDLDRRIAEGRTNKVMKRRLMRSHFSLENVKIFLKANDLSKLDETWLLHLSDANSDAIRFKKEIAELTGKPVYIP